MPFLPPLLAIPAGSRPLRVGSAWLAWIALLAGLLALTACDDASEPGWRERFDPGAAGWTQFGELARVDGTDLGPAHSVKALVLDALTDPKVYFIPTRQYALHYDFAHDLDPKRFPTRAAFDAQIYHGAGHPHLACTLVWYPELTVTGAQAGPQQAPMALWLFPSDVAPLPQVMAAYQALLERMAMVPRDGGDRRLAWVPANAAAGLEAKVRADELAAAGVLWLDQTELYAGVTQQALNPGVTFGTLRQVSGKDLQAGKVSYRDVVVLDRLPLDLPLVGGTITEELQTPLAHVNVAAKARGTPNLALLGASTDPRVLPLLGQTVRFEVKTGGFDLRAATAQEVEAFWQKRLNRPEFRPPADLGPQGVLEFDQVGFAAAGHVGVKAANYAELHHLWQDHKSQVKEMTGGVQDSLTPLGLAVPFAEYERHLLAVPADSGRCHQRAMACQADADEDDGACAKALQLCLDVVASAKPLHLKDYIAAVLARSDFAADSLLRSAVLHGIRHAIATWPTDIAFGKALDAAIQARFASVKVRLRSSTNAEDLEGFSGAGLYESVSAYAEGPKRASLRIRDTWASVWTFRAFEERSFWRIRHLDVRMGVLVHQAWPEELANGVLVTKNLADPDSWGYYVNVQQGEMSVTNPTDGITPEVFTLYWHWKDVPDKAHPGQTKSVLEPAINRLLYSSLSPGQALLDDSEALALVRAMHLAVGRFAKLYGKTEDAIAFEVEFKIHDAVRRLIIKQIRPY